MNFEYSQKIKTQKENFINSKTGIQKSSLDFFVCLQFLKTKNVSRKALFYYGAELFCCFHV
jgi:hypothetical protein